MSGIPANEHSYEQSQPMPLQSLIKKLQLWAPLSAADRSALLALPFTLRSLKAEHYVVRDGDQPQLTCLLVRGFAYRHKIVSDGGTQIFSLHMDGDVVDLQNSLLGRADHNVQMLSDGEVAFISAAAIREVAFARHAIGIAMWYETLVEGSIVREWIANIGRRDAHTRIAHLLCEVGLRLEVAGLGNKTGYTLPMTQEWIADALGLTPVHVNRILRKLHKEGLIGKTKRQIAISDWNALAIAADFNPAYLHLHGLH